MKIFGQVVDTNNEPMQLANITVVIDGKYTNKGTSTNLDGNFVLEDASISPDSEFKISYVGYVSQFRKASELQGQKIKLAEDVEMLEEVIVTGKPKPSKGSANSDQVKSSKQKFVQHLEKHKFVYAGLGGLAGILLIAKAFKK
jgi:hypothetical protein